MRIVTWNVNSVRARMERVLPWLEKRRPEVVCLQEIKCEEHQFPREPLEDLGYSISLNAQKSYNGVAILSLRSPDEVVRGFGDEAFDGEARVIGATFEDWMVLNLYVVNGVEVGHDRYQYKLRWLERLGTFLEEHYPAGEKVVVVGDFNVTFDDRDVYDPKRWHERILCSTPEREALGNVLEKGRLRDALRSFHEEGGIYTWWDYRRRGYERGNRGLRIDHVLVSEPAFERCQGVEVDAEERGGTKPSDHAPVIATFS